jgi:hypothetical protein
MPSCTNKSGARAADLPLVEPDGVDQAFDGAVDIGVVEDDVGGLAAQLEREGFARAGRRLADAAAHGGGAGEGDLGDAGMLDDRLPRRAVAGDDVDDALRQPGLPADIGEKQRGERGVFCGFQDHRVSRGERGRDLPRQHQEREVPRDDLAADAERFMVQEFLCKKLRQARVVVEMPLGEGDVDVAASRIGLPLSRDSSTAKRRACFCRSRASA